MNRANCFFVLCLMLQPAIAATTNEDYWKNCPGPACPANAPSQETEAYIKKERPPYGGMDKKQLDQEQKLHEKEIKKIQREERLRYDR